MGRNQESIQRRLMAEISVPGLEPVLICWRRRNIVPRGGPGVCGADLEFQAV